MIRRFNYTDRLRIRRSDVRIVLREEDGKLEFDADLRALADYDLPPDSLVFVEASACVVCVAGAEFFVRAGGATISARMDSPHGNASLFLLNECPNLVTLKML